MPTYTSISYFGTKAVHAGLAKHALSENLFWSDAFTFWSLLDTVPLLMCLLCSIAVDMTLRQRAYAVDGDNDDIPFLLRTGVAITTVSENDLSSVSIEIPFLSIVYDSFFLHLRLLASVMVANIGIRQSSE